jgi:hypothetical protein
MLSVGWGTDMNKLLIMLTIALCSISQAASGQQDTQSKNDKLRELIERQRAIEVSISTGGGNFGPVRESFRAGEPITIVVSMINRGNEMTGVTIADPYYQNRPKLMKDGQEIPYRSEVVEVLKWKEREGCGAGRIFGVGLEPNGKKDVDFLMINEGPRVTHNIIWYAPLEPGKYELSIRRRFGCYKEPEAESNTIQFEVVAGESQASPNNGMHPTANSMALMRETPFLSRFVAAGDAGR